MTNLQRIRKESGLTQKQLAEKSGVNLKMIRKYEQGVQDINRAAAITVLNLAWVLNCDITEIMELIEI
jgi:transcriptional regulator with XRE-family HTH domain